MNSKKSILKLNAFTILEVTIGMAISGILIAMVYIAFNFLIQQSYEDIKFKNDISKWLIFRQRILEDVYLARDIQFFDEGLRVYHYNGDSTTYFIEDETLFVDVGDSIINTTYHPASISLEKDLRSENFEGVLTVQLRTQDMQLYFGSFKDVSSRINEWYLQKNK